MSADTPVLRWACPQGFELLPDHIRTADCRDWLEASTAPLLWLRCQRTPSTSTAKTSVAAATSPIHVPLIQTQNLVRRVPSSWSCATCRFRQQNKWRLPAGSAAHLCSAAFSAVLRELAEYAMQRYGASRIQQVMLSARLDTANYMPPVKAALEDGELVGLPKDADILADLRAVQIVKGVPRIPDSRSTGEDKGKRHGDAAVAVALAYFASREINKGPVTVKSRRRRAGSKITKGFV